jgi:hypothetical protein
MFELSSRFGSKKGGNFPFLIKIIVNHNLLILNEIGINDERPPPSQIIQQELLMEAEEREEYF